MNIKRNIIFTPENRKKNGRLVTENVPVRMRLVYGGSRVDFTTGIRIDVQKWDNAKQRAKNGCTNKLKQSSTEINAALSKYYSDIQNIFKEYEINDTLPTPDQIKRLFRNKTKKDFSENAAADITLQQAIELFTKECGRQNNWTEGTYEKFITLKNHLNNFNERLVFTDMTEECLSDYISYLQDEKKLRNTTINKQISLLKWFLRWALKRNYPVNNSFLTFKPKLKVIQKKVIFLTWEELNKLKDYKIPPTKKYLEQVKDVFLFCCFTGLRYSDVYNLKRSDIKKDHIEITTVKTSDSLVIELNNYSRFILNKYEKVHFKNDKALPVISNQKMNDYLKELAELAEINELVSETYYKGNKRMDEVKPKHALLSTHAARRTFICNALALGIQPQVIMKWTGHSDYKSMKPYIDIADEVKADAMSKFNQL